MEPKYVSNLYLSELQTRRRFLRQAFGAVAGTAVMSGVLRDLRFINAALAQTGAANGYKALVCVFLNGGNDANNMIIPIIPSEWQSYAAVRTNALAIPNTDGGPATCLRLKTGTAINASSYMDAAGHNYGVHPAMKEIGGDLTNGATSLATTPGLFNTGKCALIMNTGTLSYPMTKAQYFANSVAKPPQLFSHSDQQAQWQTSISDQAYSSGWAGRMADLFGGNSASGVNGYLVQPGNVPHAADISMAVTLAGSNIFEVGSQNLAPQYSVSTSGAVKLSAGITGGTNNLNGTFTNVLNGDVASADLQTAAYANVLSQAISEANTVSTALTNLASTSPSYLSRFPANVITPNGGATVTNSSLMAQMKMVAQLIDIGKNQLHMKRQIFFIQVGGYDTHTVQTTSTATGTFTNANVIIGAQAQLLAELSQTLNALHLAMGDLGLLNDSFHTPDANMQNHVTAFTVSDFARTFPSNGSGSDHGWGSHHLVVGGDVLGGTTYGKLPTLTVNGPDDTGTGRWIPTQSVDQYAATLATWFGVDPDKLATIFPNLSRFSSSSLGFMKNPPTT